MKKVLWSLIVFFSFLLTSHAEIESAIFVSCVDGDTAVFSTDTKDETHIRFIAIDAPEITEDKEDIGSQAKKYTCERLEKADNIYIEIDEKAERDKYDRLLGWIWVDGNLLQKDLVTEGYAKVAYVYDDYKYAKSLCIYEKDAIGNQKGIWKESSDIGYCSTIDTEGLTSNIDFNNLKDEAKDATTDAYTVLKKIDSAQKKVSKYADNNQSKIINYGFYLMVGAAIIYILYKEFKG